MAPILIRPSVVKASCTQMKRECPSSTCHHTGVNAKHAQPGVGLDWIAGLVPGERWIYGGVKFRSGNISR